MVMGCELQQTTESMVWGSQGMVVLCLVYSAVDGMADSIVGSLKFKGVQGLSFSS